MSDLQATVVLYIDDDIVNIRVVQRMLKQHPYEVLSLREGLQAVATAQNLQPALILLDVHMPDVSGLEVAAALQREPRTAHIPIVALTADQAISSTTHAQLFQDVLHKPLARMEVIRTVQRYALSRA